MIAVARRLGGPRTVCRVLSGQRYPEVDRRQGLEWVVECINQSLAVAREHDIVLGLENHYKDGFWKYPEFAQKMDVFLELLDAIPDRDHFGVQYDPSNAIVAGDDPIALLRAVADRVVSMHASDRYLAEGATLDDLRQTDGTLGYSPNLRHGVTGKGLNDYRRHLPHPGRARLPRLDQHRGRHERHGRDGRVAGVPAAHEREVFSGLRPCDGPSCGPPWSAAARSARFTPRPWPAFPSRSSSPSATSTSSAPRRSRAASGVGPSTDVGRMLAEGRAEVRLHRHAAPAARRAGDRGRSRPACTSWSKSRWRRASPTATRCSRPPRAAGVKLGVISQRRWYEPVRRMKDAIDAGKIGRPVLGVFTMYSWRDPAYYRSDPWRGRWDTEGGGVLVNQSPHHARPAPVVHGRRVAEVSGYWANLNHPDGRGRGHVPSRSSAFASGGLGSIVTSLSQKPGIYTKVHIHGSNGRLGRRRDRPRRDLHRRSLGHRRAAAQRPVDDPRRGGRPPAVPGRGPCPVRDDRRGRPLPRPANPRLPPSRHRDRPPLVTGADGRRVVALFQAIYQSNREGRSVKLAA